jgi:excisionase family DNA binding protein
MKFSIGQAATKTGKPKSTISRAIKTGRLSATRSGNRYDIDAAELFRVFPATVAQPNKPNDEQPHDPTGQADILTRLALAEAALDAEREKNAMLQRHLDDVRRMLPPPESPGVKKRPRSWWPWDTNK